MMYMISFNGPIDPVPLSSASNTREHLALSILIDILKVGREGMALMVLVTPLAMVPSARLWVRAVEQVGLKAQINLHMGYHRGKMALLRLGPSTLKLDHRGSTKSGGAPSQFTATIMACLMESGEFQTHISHILQPAYERRYRIMISAIHQYLLPLGVKLPQVDRDIVGGYFIWLLLPPGLHADHVASRAQEEEMLTVAQGSLFGVHGDIKGQGLDGGIRVCFSYESENMLSEGIERLGKVIQRMQQPVVQPICALRIPPN